MTKVQWPFTEYTPLAILKPDIDWEAIEPYRVCSVRGGAGGTEKAPAERPIVAVPPPDQDRPAAMPSDVPIVSLYVPRFVVNGFPKSGTHLMSMLISPIAMPQVHSQQNLRPWVGTFNHNAWTNERIAETYCVYKLSQLQPGYWFMGHIGYSSNLERFMFYMGAMQIFIFRDLRDVAISQAHHIFEDDEDLKHPDKDAYRRLGSFDDILAAVIKGYTTPSVNGTAGRYYPGVIERWEEYAGWLDCPWVAKVRYRDARLQPKAVAEALLDVSLKRLSLLFGLAPFGRGPAFESVSQRMADASTQTEHSPTFRKGSIGDWGDRFTEKHKQLWKDTDPKNWVTQLGFEEDQDW